MKDQASVRDRCIAKRIKFQDLAGIHYKSYVSRDASEKRAEDGETDLRDKVLDRCRMDSTVTQFVTAYESYNDDISQPYIDSLTILAFEL